LSHHRLNRAMEDERSPTIDIVGDNSKAMC
jgi:hypothetical protein